MFVALISLRRTSVILGLASLIMAADTLARNTPSVCASPVDAVVVPGELWVPDDVLLWVVMVLDTGVFREV